MASDLVDHLVKIHNREKTDFRWRNLRKLVRKHVVGTRILDAGCGTGHTTLELLRESYDVTAIDNSEDLIAFTKTIIEKRGFNANVLQLDLTESAVLGENRFDTILCLDVLEHINDDRMAMENLYKILNINGTIIISVPAIKYLYGIRDKKMGHFRRYDRGELIEKLKESGFDVVDVRYWNFLGVLPFLFSEKVLHKELNEGVRYSNRSYLSKILTNILNTWFEIVENNVRFPVGLSIIVIGKK
jgi:SAM-dependent methyltransferase